MRPCFLPVGWLEGKNKPNIKIYYINVDIIRDIKLALIFQKFEERNLEMLDASFMRVAYND